MTRSCILLLTGVQVKLVVEKGIWQEVYPLEGGHLHLKMQFILNDEERERIRMMVLIPFLYRIFFGDPF